MTSRLCCCSQGVSEEWRALIEDAHERSCCYQVASSKDVQSVISLRNDRRSPAKTLDYITKSFREARAVTAT